MTAPGRTLGEAIRAIGVAKVTYHIWRSEFGGLKLDQVRRLKELELENNRLRKAVPDLTSDKLILTEALSDGESAARVAGRLSRRCAPSSACPNGARARSLTSCAQPNAVCRTWPKMTSDSRPPVKGQLWPDYGSCICSRPEMH